MNSIYKRLLVHLLFLFFSGKEVYAQRFLPVWFYQLPKDMQLYARDDNNLANVPITGKVEFTGWDYVSVVTFRNNVRHGYNRSVLNYNGNPTADFNLQPTIKAEIADYSFEIYACQQSDSVLLVRRNEIVAGDFFVINGQSNASAIKFGDWGSKYCRTLARIPDDNPGVGQGDTLWIQSSWSWPYVGAWGLQLQRKIFETHGIPTCIINGSLPGSKIAWHTERNPDNPAGPSLYGNLLLRVKVAKPARIRAFFWYQGEQEALEDIHDYPEQYDKLFKFWQIDYPTVDKFVVMQIPVLFNPYYVAGTIRDFQRRTKYLYPKSDHFSTMGLPYFDGIHYDIKGYYELGTRLFNFLGPGIYKTPPVDNAACPDIKKVFYTSDKKDEITLVFDEGQKLIWPNDTLMEDVNYQFFTKSLEEVFFFDGDENESRPPVVKEGIANGNRVKIILHESSAATKLNYLPAYKGEKIRIYYGPFLKNTRGLGAFSFQNISIYDALKITNFKAAEISTGAVNLTWNAVANATYILYRKAEGENSFTKIQELDGTKISYNDTNVLPGKLYVYQLMALNSNSESELNEVSIKTSSALPVTLVHFAAARINQNTVQLDWTTTEEINNLQFEIQRSENPQAGFMTVGIIDGSGNSGVIENYEFEDINSITQLTYYRLRQVDFDGSFTYSRIVTVKPFKLNLELIAFPNPSIRGNVQFQLTGLTSPETISILVYDSKGTVLYKNDAYQLDNRYLILMDAFTNKYKGQLFIKIATKQGFTISSFVI